MYKHDDLELSDLFILMDESEKEITDLSFEYYMPNEEPSKRLASEFHKALKMNISISDALLDAMAKEVAYPRMACIYHDVYPTANCTFNFLKESLSIQKSMAESHDTLREIEKKFRFLGSPLRIAI